MTGLSSHLLSLLYASATDNGKWVDFCAEMNRQLDVPFKIYGHSARTYESLGLIGAGFDPTDLDRYHAYFAPLNPWMHMNLALPVGEVGVSDAGLPRDELLKTEFYNDWLRAQDNVVAGAAMICHRSDDRFIAMVAACRARGLDETLPNAQHLMTELSPHITRSIALSGALLSGTDCPMAHLADLPHAVILVHRSGRAGYRNAAAERFLTECNLFVIGHDGGLSAKDPVLHRHLRRCIEAMQTDTYDAPMLPVAVHTSAFGTCVLHAHPFPSICGHGFPEAVWSDPVVGGFVFSGAFGLEKGLDYQRLAASLGATEAEARLAQALLDGYALYEYAEARGLSRHTVRNQMRALLHKTGTRNQTDFVRHLQRLASPFGHYDS